LEKTELAWTLSSTAARFLVQGGKVEYGEVDGVDVESRGSSNHQQEDLAEEARVSVLL
jgi:hypothetical protein